MSRDLFQGLGVNREGSKRYGRFKALEGTDSEDLNHEYGAEKVAENIMAQVDENIEQLLVERGHMPKEDEISHEEFQEVHNRVQNIENEWEAAFKQKDYGEVEISDLKVLRNLLSSFKNALRYELKVTNYIDLFHSEISSLEVDGESIKTFLDLKNCPESSEVGKHLKEVNKKRRYDISKLKSMVEERLQDNSEQFEEQIKEFENQVDFYKRHVDILEAIEKELLEIKKRNDNEEVKEEADELRGQINSCLNLIIDLVERKKEVIESHTKAKKLKKNVNRLFLSGL